MARTAHLATFPNLVEVSRSWILDLQRPRDIGAYPVLLAQKLLLLLFETSSFKTPA
jgi:hypothetical protein